nr:uncharacterized protein I203_05890 [Kwoniella mangroviensis CBS 8507]OCF65148.1 hypothetical protein I203_05890 [Kwoniella mangroviensis CBS 8507]
MKNNNSLTPFPEEVLRNILQYCLEEGRDGSFIPQPTLASALRVNTVFYLLASPVLYHSPTAMDINSFFLGSDALIPAVDMSSNPHQSSDAATLQHLRKGYTKSSLLKHVTRFRFLPRSVPVEGVDLEEQSSLEYFNRVKQDPRYYQGIGQTYGNGFELIQRLRNIKREYEKEGKGFLIMPRLKGISVGSDLTVYNSEERRIGEISDKLYNNWGTALVNLRLHLWEIFNRNEDGMEWCEWQNGGLPLMELENPEYIDQTRLLPRVFTIHTDLMDHIPLLWGCTNRIVIRRKDDEDYWSREKYRSLGRRIPPGSNLDDDTPEPESYGGEGLLPQDEHNMMEEYEIISLILNSIYDSHPKIFKKKIRKDILQKEIENKTVFEIYGFEGICLPQDCSYDYHWTARGSNEWDRDPDVDMKYVDEELRNAGFAISNTEGPSSRETPADLTSTPHLDSDDEVDPMQAVLVSNPSADSDVDHECDRIQAVPLPGHPATSREHDAKMKLWLQSFDYQMIKLLHDCFESSRSNWKNGENSAGPKIRYLPFRELPKCNGCKGKSKKKENEKEEERNTIIEFYGFEKLFLARQLPLSNQESDEEETELLEKQIKEDMLWSEDELKERPEDHKKRIHSPWEFGVKLPKVKFLPASASIPCDACGCE